MTSDQVFQTKDVQFIVKSELTDPSFRGMHGISEPQATTGYHESGFYFAESQPNSHQGCTQAAGSTMLPIYPTTHGNPTAMMPTTPTTPIATHGVTMLPPSLSVPHHLSPIIPMTTHSSSTAISSPSTLPFSPAMVFDTLPRPVMTTSSSAPTTMISMSPSHYLSSPTLPNTAYSNYTNPAINSELKRQIHIQSEQKRRAQIKDGFEDLRNELPSCLNKKMSKVALLHRTVQHIQHLKSTQATILSELERLMVENEHLRKFQQSVLQKHPSEYQMNAL
ncbi:HLH-domain-containing protein [Hesseltinella vesiculosa]|uniref:HLH-domain-containing protein n=1 Tax=Hesseltinella vesiculosa TaxID=101127 RepID=A0A1X2GPJ8_9FUNG|nr:HLH-domain-containing protein [Hesseltinella vesiculosa]